MMRIRSLFIGSFLALSALTTAASGDQGPTLKPVVTVHAGLVTLGDLIDNPGAAAKIAVFRAPDLGTAGTVRADRIVEAALANGISGLKTNGIASVSVRRLGRSIGSDEMTGAIARRMVEGGQASDIGTLDIALDRAAKPIVIESTAIAPLSIETFDYDPRNGRFAATLSVRDSAAIASGLRVTGRAIEMVDVPVLVRVVPRGERIAASDVAIERIARTALPRTSHQGGVIADFADIVGKSARRQLRPGEPLTRDHLMEPILVQRGDLVTIVFRSPGIVLTTRGRALGSGIENDVVAVFNIQSKRTIEAIVTGTGQVAVMPQHVPVASLAAAATQ